jgi:hypothetical protein
MQHVIVQYRVHPDRAEENEALVRDVYAGLQELAPDGLRYATYVLPDGVTFVHVAHHAGEDASPLSGIAAFRRFQEGIAERCEDGPHVRDVRRIGAFG